MEDAFGGSGGLRHRRKLKKGEPGERPPASLGVRLGYVADVEHPPPKGVSSTRRTKRIPTSVQIRVGGRWLVSNQAWGWSRRPPGRLTKAAGPVCTIVPPRPTAT